MSVAGWKPARRKPSYSSKAAAATMAVTSTAVAARPIANAKRPTTASTAPVMRRVVKSSRDRGARRTIVPFRCAVGARAGSCARTGARAPGRCAARGDLGCEQLVVVDVGNVDERAERAAVFVVHRLVVEVGEVGLGPVALAAEAGRAPGRREHIVVERVVARDHGHFTRRRLRPMWSGTGPLASPVGAGGGVGRGVGMSNSLVRSVGSGNRAAGRASGGDSRRGRGGSSRERPPLASTAACASSAPRMRTPSFGGASVGSSSKSSGTAAKARPVARVETAIAAGRVLGESPHGLSRNRETDWLAPRSGGARSPCASGGRRSRRSRRGSASRAPSRPGRGRPC